MQVIHLPVILMYFDPLRRFRTISLKMTNHLNLHLLHVRYKKGMIDTCVHICICMSI